MAKIYCNNKQYNGMSASVTFENGVGDTNVPHLINWFQEHGYTVEDEIAPKDIERMTYKELTEYAKERGFNGIGYKKPELIKALQELDSKEKTETEE